MKVTAVVSTKGGPGKTTVGVNLGAFCADDLDNQPSLSSLYAPSCSTREMFLSRFLIAWG